MRIAFFYLCLLGVLLLCWRRGGHDERAAAIVCLAGTLATGIMGLSLPEPFARFRLVPFLIDLAVLAAFINLALRSTRYWPLWIAGFQLTAASVHLLKLLNPTLLQFVFGAALAFWSYPILLIIAIGAWRTATVDRWREAAAIAGERATS